MLAFESRLTKEEKWLLAVLGDITVFRRICFLRRLYNQGRLSSK